MPNFLDTLVMKALTEAGNQVVSQARANASWSKEIPNAISLGTAEVIPGGYEIKIILNAKSEGGVPQAAAFEFGSGIHRTVGTAKTYVIKPKNANYLYFPWNPKDVMKALNSRKVHDYWDDAGLWVFKYIDHPGVAARPFVRPAIEAHKPTIKTKLLLALRAGFRNLLGIRVEVIK